MERRRRVGGEILSVDSMQVYRGMDIGTAKPTRGRAARGAASPDRRRRARTRPFTVARFVELADAVIADAAARGVPLIATGGTPLYYKALFEGMFDGPGATSEVRERLRLLPNEELHRRLAEVDPAAAARIHANDTKRLVRALEVLELTGQPISSLQTEWATRRAAPRREVDRAGVGQGRAEPPDQRAGEGDDRGGLGRRSARRCWRATATLSKTAAEATGYAELIEHFAAKLSLDDAVEQIKIATRQLARRQMKWFRRFRNVTWIAGDRPLEEKVERVMDLWPR